MAVTLHDLDVDFDEFVRDASPSLLRTAYLLTGDLGHAEDIMQTALLRTARRWASARREPVAYARRVVVNLVKDRWRDRGRRVTELALASREPIQDGPDAQIVLRQTLLPAMQLLPARQRAVLVLRFFVDLSVAETAATLGCSAGTVKSQTSAALANLRATLGADLFTKEIESCSPTPT